MVVSSVHVHVEVSITASRPCSVTWDHDSKRLLGAKCVANALPDTISCTDGWFGGDQRKVFRISNGCLPQALSLLFLVHSHYYSNNMTFIEWFLCHSIEFAAGSSYCITRCALMACFPSLFAFLTAGTTIFQSVLATTVYVSHTSCITVISWL